MDSFREKKLCRIGKLARDKRPKTARRYGVSPEFIRPAAGSLLVALRAHLPRFLGPNATDWMIQFVAGFPLAGALSRRYTFPLDAPPADPPCAPRSLFAINASSFNNARAGPPLNKPMLFRLSPCDRRMMAVSSRRIRSTLGGTSPRYSAGACNTAFRFDAPYVGKLRGCGDLKDSIPNTETAVLTPVSLCGWDHIDGTNKIPRDTPRSWASGEIEHVAAYKFPPIRPSGDSMDVVTLCRSVP